MSVQSPIYIMWGLMLDYPKDGDEIYDRCAPYIDSAYDKEPKPGVTVLWGEEFVAIGHVLARSNEYGSDLGNHTIPFPPMPGLPAEDVMRYSKWRLETGQALKATGLEIPALGLSFQWHVIQHYR